MSDLAIAYRQTKFEVQSFRRNRAGAFFTVVFPIMFLLVFGTLNDGATIDTRSGLPFIQFFMPGILAFGIISACYTSIGMRVSILRDSGVLKRMRGTPMPAWTYLAGQIGAAIVVSIALSAVTIAVSVAAFGAHLYADSTLGLLLTGIVGAACFCALGLAITTVIPNGDSAPAIVQFALWPVLFISNVFYPIDDAPQWLHTVADIFPIKHLADGLQYAMSPHATSSGIHGGGVDLLVLGVWMLIGGMVAARRFRWESKQG